MTGRLLGVLLAGLCLGAPSAASAANMYGNQVLFLLHMPLGGGTFFTTNYLFAATESDHTIVNVKCFNDAGQRIGPADGVDVDLRLRGDIAQHTPTTLLVTTDPLFSSGIGWCWAHDPRAIPYNVQITIGATTNLQPRGILDSTTSTLVGSSMGLDYFLQSIDGRPIFGGTPFATADDKTLTYLMLINPTTRDGTVTLTLRGRTLRRRLTARSLQALSIPGVFGVGPMPEGGSVTISVSGRGEGGVLGWLVTAQPSTGRLQFTAVGLDASTSDRLPSLK